MLVHQIFVGYDLQVGLSFTKSKKNERFRTPDPPSI